MGSWTDAQLSRITRLRLGTMDRDMEHVARLGGCRVLEAASLVIHANDDDTNDDEGTM